MTAAATPQDPRQGLRAKTLSGLRWSFSSTALSTFIQLAHMVIMARLLAPEDFGLVALAAAFLRFGTYFAQIGVGQALMQRLTLSEREIRTAFTSSVLLGVLLAGVFFAAAPLAEAVAHAPEVVPVIKVLALSMIIAGLGITALSLLKRDLRFRGLAVLEVGSYVVGYVLVGITLASLGYGVWSLVFAALCQALLQTIGAYVMTRHTTQPLLAWTEIKALYGYGAKFSGTQLLNVIRHALITAAVGRVAGIATLGLFDRARLLVQLPFEKLEATVTKVLFPAMSRVQTDIAILKRFYLVQKGLIVGLFLPTLAGMAVSAEIIIAALLGPQWSGATPLVPWLAAAVGIVFAGHFSRVLCDVLALMNQRLFIEMVHVALLAAGVALGSWWFGIHGLLVAIVIAEVASYSGYTWLMRKRLYVDWRNYVRTVLPGLLATFVVAVILFISQDLISGLGAPASVALMGQVFIGFVTLLAMWRSGLFRQLRSDIASITLGEKRAADLTAHKSWRVLMGGPIGTR
jgi:lipopolysaccharide exporter